MNDKQLVQEFECLITCAKKETIECEMHDLTNLEPVEYAEIYRSRFKNFDPSVLTEGRVFYWKIYKQENSNFFYNYLDEFFLKEEV